MLKYVIKSDGDRKPIVYIFSKTIGHYCFESPNIIGAGFFKIEDGRVKCFGESTSLGIKSRGRLDEIVITEQLEEQS